MCQADARRQNPRTEPPCPRNVYHTVGEVDVYTTEVIFEKVELLLSEYRMLKHLKAKERQVFEEGRRERTHSFFTAQGVLLRCKK